jgi:regulator of chromosome condensation
LDLELFRKPTYHYVCYNYFQLGLGPDVVEARKLKVVTALNGKPVVAICAGGMHSLCLTKDGVVYSFGCNDNGALGRLTEDEDETYTPGIFTNYCSNA